MKAIVEGGLNVAECQSKEDLGLEFVVHADGAEDEIAGVRVLFFEHRDDGGGFQFQFRTPLHDLMHMPQKAVQFPGPWCIGLLPPEFADGDIGVMGRPAFLVRLCRRPLLL